MAEVTINLTILGKGHEITRLDNKSWKIWNRKADVENFTWHGLRHTWATRFMRAGGSILELVQLGAWSDPSVPMKRYAHLDISDQRRALEEQVVLGRLGTPQDVAAAVLYLASEEGGYVTGETINVSGGLYI